SNPRQRATLLDGSPNDDGFAHDTRTGFRRPGRVEPSTLRIVSQKHGRWHVASRKVPVRRTPTDREYADLLAFRTAMRRFMQWSEERAQAEGMTHLQHQLLLAVGAHGDDRGPTGGEAAEYLLMTPSSASELVDRAEAGGFVRRERSGEDARVVRLHLTAVGEQKLAALTIDVLSELARVGPVLQLVLADAARGL